MPMMKRGQTQRDLDPESPRYKTGAMSPNARATQTRRRSLAAIHFASASSPISPLAHELARAKTDMRGTKSLTAGAFADVLREEIRKSSSSSRSPSKPTPRLAVIEIDDEEGTPSPVAKARSRRSLTFHFDNEIAPSADREDSPGRRRPSLHRRKSNEALPSTPGDGSVLLSRQRTNRQCLILEAMTAPEPPRTTFADTDRLMERAVALDLEGVKELLDRGTSVNVAYSGGPSEPSFVTLLHRLCGMPLEAGEAQHRSLEIVELLLRSLADLNPRSSWGCTPLMHACRRRNIELVKLLIEYGADVMPTDDRGYDSLLWSIVLDPPRVSRQPRQLSFNTSLVPAVSHVDREDHRVEEPASVEGGLGEDSRKDVPFRSEDHCDSCVDDEDRNNGLLSSELVRILLFARAPSATIRRTLTSLDVDALGAGVLSHRADEGANLARSFRRGDPGVKDFVRWVDSEYVSPIESWCLGNSETDDAVGQRYKMPPLLLAVENLNHEAASLLLEMGTPPNFLHEAVKTEWLPMVQVLLAGKADPRQPNMHGDSPMDLALQIRGQEDSRIMEALREAAKDWPNDLVYKKESEGDSRSKSRKSRQDARTSGRRSIRFSHIDTIYEALHNEPEENRGWWWSIRSTLTSICVFVAAGVDYILGTAVPEVSRQCRHLSRNDMFQTLMFTFLILALFLPDLWVIMDVRSDSVLDLFILILMASFLFDQVIQAVGFRKQYLCTLLFIMDLVGTCSFLLDLSVVRRATKTRGNAAEEALGGDTVLLRAARAAKLGARMGRFTRVAKLLRFLHGHENEDRTGMGTAKVLTRILVTRLSTRVSLIIIFMMMLLDIYTSFEYPHEDWAMLMWTEEVERTVFENATQVDALIVEVRTFFKDRNYVPFKFLHGRRILWASPVTPWYTDEWQVKSGDVTVLFDSGGQSRQEAGLNMSTIIFTIGLLVAWSHLISNSVKTIAVTPLEKLLLQVKLVSSTMFKHVEKMHACHEAAVGQAVSLPVDEDMEQASHAPEIKLLEKVVRKLSALSEIVAQQAKPADTQAMQYLGQSQVGVTSQALRKAHFGDRPMLEKRPILERRSSCNWEESNLLSLDFNVGELDVEQTTAVCLALLRSATDKLPIGVSRDKLRPFVEAACAGYLREPQYHNWQHAVDVTHVLFVVFEKCCFSNTLMSGLEVCALLASAVCHDIGHFGVNNDFLLHGLHELAICYNDKSPLENLHCARFFEILGTPCTAIFENLSKEQYREMRAISIEAILHTDTTYHVRMIQGLEIFQNVNADILASARESCLLDGSSWPPPSLVQALWAKDSRPLLRNVLLHFADISNPMRPFDICKQWAYRILEEFFSQGDVEKQIGVPVLALNCREKTNRPFSQISFIEFFVAPLAFAMVRILSPLEELAQQLLYNSESWVNQWAEEVEPSTEDKAGAGLRLKRLEERFVAVVQATPPRNKWSGDTIP